MTIFPIKNSEISCDRKNSNMIKLDAIGKKYPVMKTANKVLFSEFAEFWALKDISFSLKQGEVLGIIGRNGAGKTTLLNIVAGTLSPTQGSVSLNGKVLVLFNLCVGFQDELSGRENIFLNGAILGASRKELEAKLGLIIEFSELGDFINMPLGSYSQGMRLRLGFSIVANLDFDVLLIDEVLAVGDTLFQNKCFERLMNFKRSGRNLIITTQSMDLIERLCDKVALLDHGNLEFFGDVREGVNRYQKLLNSEKFFVGPAKKERALFEDTKKWADDLSVWGKKLGTREIEIDSVKFINRMGAITSQIKSGEFLRIKVEFNAKNTVKDVHFGIAIFRRDGVYCHGPNTSFDNHNIPEIKPGKGWFLLEYKEVLLGSGEYNVSVAIWDRNETLAFVYHNGYYDLTVVGCPRKGELLNLPFRVLPRDGFFGLFNRVPELEEMELSGVENTSIGQNVSLPGYKATVRLLDYSGREKKLCFTNEEARFVVSLNTEVLGKDNFISLGIFREDGILCQKVVNKIGERRELEFLFPKLALLPGGYKVALGIWNQKSCGVLIYNRDIFKFRMISERADHGTVYFEHKWRWSLP